MTTSIACPRTGQFLSGITVGVFSLTLFVSATLMFAIQPMTGKMLLPLVGGTPSGWIVAMAFFQVMLLAGYLLAHLLSGFSPRLHAGIYLCGLALGLYFMPADVRHHSSLLPPSPAPRDIFELLCVSLAIPFILLSATSSTVQRLFTETGHRSAHDPYFLYVASNTGSLAGLLLYPFVFEPLLSLSAQSAYATNAYVLLILCGLLCLFMSFRLRRAEEPLAAAPPRKNKSASEAPLPLTTRLEWVALSFFPSSLLLGTTIYITTDIMSVPLLWALPLSLYLMTFMIAFSGRRKISSGSLQHLHIAAAFLSILMACVIQFPWLSDWSGLCFHLTIFTVIALCCHIRLAERRPLDGHSRHLTSFYLMLSIGGALGGLFNAFVIPFISDRLIELPLMIAASLLLHPSFRPRGKIGMATIAMLALTTLTLPATPPQIFLSSEDTIEVLCYFLGAALITYIAFPDHRRHFNSRALILLTTGLLLASQFLQFQNNVVFSSRNFYGTLRVFDGKLPQTEEQASTARFLYHGTTVHGVQILEPEEMRTEPTSYYNRSGPLGDIFSAFEPRNVAAIGLGAGVLHCYEAEDRHFTFFEIDPAVVEVAQEYFSFLSDCTSAAPPRIIIGDGRLELARLAPETFDLIVVDAFSSDAIPVHLLTEEAIAEYLARATENGVVALHLSNRYFLLEDRIVSIAEKMGLNHMFRFDIRRDSGRSTPLRYSSKWLALSKADILTPLRQTNREWHRIKPSVQPIWTDDYSNIFGAAIIRVPAKNPAQKND